MTRNDINVKETNYPFRNCYYFDLLRRFAKNYVTYKLSAFMFN